jgi:DNA-binding transcriptional LysR family regulator
LAGGWAALADFALVPLSMVDFLAAGSRASSEAKFVPEGRLLHEEIFIVFMATMNCIHAMEALLDSKQLRAYLALARLGSFTGAARAVGLSQSAVSHAMKALETDVGCRLLDKAGKKVLLTQAGEQLLFHAEKILREMTSAREGLAQLGTWGQAKLRVAAPNAICQHVLPTVVREFRESFPQCALTVEAAENAQFQDMLRCQRVDLVLGLQPARDAPLEFRALFDDELVFLAHPLHPWSQAGRVDSATLTRQNYLFDHRTSSEFELAHEYFRAEGLSLPTGMEIGSTEATKELLKVGLGVSILPRWIARQEIAECSLVALPLGRRKLRRHWGVLHWRDRPLSLAEETFTNLCLSVTESWRLKIEPLGATPVQRI